MVSLFGNASRARANPIALGNNDEPGRKRGWPGLVHLSPRLPVSLLQPADLMNVAAGQGRPRQEIVV
jgi:hypothetical protein